MEGVAGIQSERSDFFVAGAEAFLPPSVTESNSLFFFEDITRGPLSFQFGGRYGHIETRSRDSNVFGTSRRRDFDNLSGAAGLVFSPNDEYSSAFTITYSERAPTAQELFSNGDHAATDTFETGDFGLGVEHALSFDLNLRKRTGWFTGSVSGYHSRYDGFIGLFPTGALGPAPDFNPVFAYRSVAAEFTGGELEATLHLLHPVTSQPDKPATSLHWEFKADVVRARDAGTGLSLPRIPPFHLTSALILEHRNFGARLEGVYAAPQHRITTNESDTPSYFLVNLSLTYRLVRGPNTLDLYVKGMNLTDAEAREHTSFLKERLPLPGRGIVAGMKWSF